MSEQYPLIMTEEYWANSQLSIARYYGGITFMGHRYLIVNKDGKDLFELSIEADRAGRTNKSQNRRRNDCTTTTICD